MKCEKINFFLINAAKTKHDFNIKNVEWFICSEILHICYDSRHKPGQFDLLKTKRRLLYLKTQFVRAVDTFHLGYKNQSVYAVSGTSRCLFSDKYKTHKYSVGRTYNCWMLNCWCIAWPVGFKTLTFKDEAQTALVNDPVRTAQ